MQRVPIPSVRQDERIGSSFNHIIQVVDLTERASSDTPDRNAVTLSIAVGSQNLRTQRKDRWQAPRQGAPLNSRGSERPADSKRKGKTHPSGVPQQ